MNKQRIPVVYIITQLELGGAQKVCLSLFKALQKAGYTAHLISGREGPLVKDISEHENVFLLPSMQREISLRSLMKELKNFWVIVKTLKQLKKQYPHLIVHTHSTKAGFIGRWAAWFARIRTRIHTIHGYGFHTHQSWFVWLPIYFLELITNFITTHFICVSAYDAQTGMRLFPGFAMKHSIIRAGVDTQQFSIPAFQLRAPSIKKPFIFGSISCFKPQKNLIDLLRAFKQVYQTNNRARLEIIGDGVQRKRLETWIATHTLSHVITLHGWQYSVAKTIKEWHTFALSSLWEGLPCAVIEARLQHLPIVSYKTGGIPEVVFDRQNGFLIEQGDWEELASRMSTLMNTHTLYRKMQHFPDNLEDFDNAHIITEHIALYKELSKW